MASDVSTVRQIQSILGKYGSLGMLALGLWLGGLAVPMAALAGDAPTTEEVMAAQRRWGDAIAAIGAAYGSGGDYRALAAQTVDDLYGYDEGPVLFKPTRAAALPFRGTEAEAVSYFVGGSVPEDHGFALQPWSRVRFENAGIVTDGDSAIAMGRYYFTDAQTQEEVAVDYTFGYFKGDRGQVLINLHHSSLPYQPTH
ncbi:MAG: hypothetical protein MH825_11350 [Cyanobacteria bacterium]|nr:hypothetical protein [Cyanobacteriota bacterium]